MIRVYGHDDPAEIATNVMNLLPDYVSDTTPKAKFKRAGIDFASEIYTKPKPVDLEAANTTAFASTFLTTQSRRFVEGVNNG
jgi:hypothetical protein